MKTITTSILLASFALAGCTAGEPGIRTVSVEVPTAVPCVNEDEIPAETPETPLTGDARVDSGLLKAENTDLRAETGDLRALIVPGCIRVDE